MLHNKSCAKTQFVRVTTWDITLYMEKSGLKLQTSENFEFPDKTSNNNTAYYIHANT